MADSKMDVDMKDEPKADAKGAKGAKADGEQYPLLGGPIGSHNAFAILVQVAGLARRG